MFFYAFTTFLYVIGNVEYAMSASLMMRQFNIEVQFVKSVNYTFEQSL